jgi:hypothetical protein
MLSVIESVKKKTFYGDEGTLGHILPLMRSLL